MVTDHIFYLVSKPDPPSAALGVIIITPNTAEGGSGFETNSYYPIMKMIIILLLLVIKLDTERILINTMALLSRTSI